MEYSLPKPDQLIRRECELFCGVCFYDADFGKVLHCSSDEALRVYSRMQEDEIRKFASRDECNNSSVSEWIVRFSAGFRDLWKKTNEFCKD